jgi:hypothetical protein
MGMIIARLSLGGRGIPEIALILAKRVSSGANLFSSQAALSADRSPRQQGIHASTAKRHALDALDSIDLLRQ